MSTDRLIDPLSQPGRYVERKGGVLEQRDILQRLLQNERYDDSEDVIGASNDVPTATALAAAGTNRSVTIEGSDRCGSITLTTGTGPTTGDIVTVTFATPRADDNYGVFLQARDTSAMDAVNKIRITAVTATTWTITNTSTVLPASEDHVWFFQVKDYYE